MPITVYRRLSPPKPTKVFETYWKFAAKRQELFHSRRTGVAPPWTKDPILRKHKFTNVYRASDRTSQYLIRNVLYGGPKSVWEVVFRVLLFKMFNKISTWQILEEYLGGISHRTYSFKHYDRVLTRALGKGERIYSNAYMMPSGKSSFGEERKHRNHLRLIEYMMRERLPSRISRAKGLHEVYELLLDYPMIGPFLAFQYAIDINYSEIHQFSEMDFVVPGPGARDGLAKCFSTLGDLSESDTIRWICDRQEVEFRGLGLTFQSLWGRPLQLIDCQNLLCEVDKYARVAHPSVTGISQRTRIKQNFSPNFDAIEYWFPPYWGINERIAQEHGQDPPRLRKPLQR